MLNAMTEIERPIIPVILSGGAGTRLWPLSREHYPKQLLPLAGENSLLQQTASRVADSKMFAPPIVVCNEEHRFVIAEQLRTIGLVPSRIVLEPAGRNTAPAAAAAAYVAIGQSPDALILVMPSDHHMARPETLAETVRRGLKAAERNSLVTFGIAPDGPETGYGYIRQGAPVADAEGVYRVDRFTEKPDQATAAQFLADGGYFWNSGIFLFAADTYLEALAKAEPKIAAAARDAVERADDDFDFLRLDGDAFAASPSKSIDYAVMENADNAVVVAADFGWSDLGAWSALWRIGDKDLRGNVSRGDFLTEDVTNTYIHSDGRLVAAIGVENLVIVATDDAVLVAPLDKAQNVRAIVDRLKTESRNEALMHPRVYRPWGYYQGVDSGMGYQVKRIAVYPGRSLSLQKHAHRAEHWVVVDGIARVTRGDEVFELSKNQSTYIPIGTVHRLENPGSDLLTLVEVQSGDYLGEDDIVRLEDEYGRD